MSFLVWYIFWANTFIWGALACRLKFVFVFCLCIQFWFLIPPTNRGRPLISPQTANETLKLPICNLHVVWVWKKAFKSPVIIYSIFIWPWSLHQNSGKGIITHILWQIADLICAMVVLQSVDNHESFLFFCWRKQLFILEMWLNTGLFLYAAAKYWSLILKLIVFRNH